MKDENELLVEFRDFGFQYNAQAEPTLYHIDLKIRRGEKVLIAGPSGCGKSTLASCINGLIPFSYRGESTGKAMIRGRETKEMSLFEISQTVGTVLQDSDGQFIGLTVAEDIAFALENECVRDPQLHERVRAAASLVNIESHLHHAPEDLSGGQKQRVALAGVMVNEVDLLLFDEPLANLDPATGKTAMELIEDMRRKSGAAVVIIEHRLEDVLHRDVDRIVLMNDGRILADAAPDELLSTGLLAQNGIREPLYLTALKYAGVTVTPQMRPGSIHSLKLEEAQKEKVRSWSAGVGEIPPRKDRTILLQAENIHFTYGNGYKALDGVSLTIREGEVMAIVGTNGAGKSTFSKVVCGFETPQKGRIRFGAEAAGIAENAGSWMDLSIKERADHIGYVMQNPNQMISQTMIWDEVALGLRTRGVDEAEITKRVEETLKICGLWPFRRWPVSALSFGQKKRVTIASILVLQPEMIILDEPTAGQDYRHYTEIMEFLRTLGSRGFTVVMITHDMHLMLEYAARCIVFSEKKVIADDSSAGVLTSPAVIARASLKETSLYTLAKMCGIRDERAFVQSFIDYERKNRRGSSASAETASTGTEPGNTEQEGAQS